MERPRYNNQPTYCDICVAVLHVFEGVIAISDIITLTMSPSVDLFGTTERLLAESKTRCQETARQPGGGGINVARSLHRLGADVLAVFTIGGANGDVLETMLRDEGVPCLSVPVDTDTRQNMALTVTDSNTMYHFVFPALTLKEPALQLCMDTIISMKPVPEFLVISGSLPLATPNNFYGRIIRATKANNTKVVLDVSGAAVQPSLDEGVYFAKLNYKEFVQLGYTGPDETDAQLDAMEEMVAKGYAEILVLTLGSKGALLVSRFGDRGALTPPPTDIVSHVGAGDSFVALMTYHLYRGAPVLDAFRYGVSAATAAVATEGNHIKDLSIVDEIYRQLSINPERRPTSV